MKISRNEPCPCGSGKKYKHCCGSPAAQTLAAVDDGPDTAVPRALDWLAQHHRKALASAMQEMIDETLYEILDDDEEVRIAAERLDGELWEQIQINLTEWLLAEGDIWVKGGRERVSELLLGSRGPRLSVAQRAWLEQLAQQPLRLYDVTGVVPDVSITLCDALDTGRAPQVVRERAGSRALRPGMQIAARVMALDDGHVLSGAMYGFSIWGGRAVLESLRELDCAPDSTDEDDILTVGLRIIEGWLAQHLIDPPLPELVHAPTGEPLLLTTDHYDVCDWQALADALAAQPDVRGDREAGWDREYLGDDGLTRSQATIAAAPGGTRVAVLYKTANEAERGRAWFDALAGESVTHRLREVSDPRGVVSRARSAVGGPTQHEPAPLPPGMDAADLADVMADFIRRHYANWPDEPIPVLGNQTPRQAIATPAGLERVKGLLRSYEDGEAGMAATQGRRAISYQFLWDALGLQR